MSPPLPLVAHDKAMSEEAYGRLIEDVIGLYLERELTWPERRDQLRRLSDRYLGQGDEP